MTANTVFQLRRNSVGGTRPTTTTVAPGELAINTTDGILFSANSTGIFEIGANNTNIRVTGNATINAIIANGSIGSNGQVLTSNGGGLYWSTSTTSSSFVRQTFTANATVNTTFTITGGYTVNYLDVYKNGVKLVNGVSVTVNNGSTVVLATPAASGDIIDIVGLLTGTVFTINTAAQYSWTNTHSFSNTITFSNTTAINITTRTSSGSNGATLSALGTAGLWLIANTLSTSATGETSPRDIFFKPDGLKMYFTGSTTDNVFEYDLATAWEVGTATYTANVASGDASPEGLFFRSNGTKMYVLGSSGDTVREFNLSAAWSVNTATFVGSFSVASQDTTPTGISFSDTGDKMFIMGVGNDRLFEYDLSTPWVVNTAVYNSQSFSVAAQDSVPHSVNFNSTGTRFFFNGIATDALYWYDLATPWSVNTAVYVDSRSLGNDSRQALGVWVESSQNKAWIADDTNDRIIQYSTNNAGLNVNSAVNHFTGFTDFSSDVGITGKLHVADDITTEASLVVGSSFNSGGAVTLATTTSVINMGGSQTTGNTIIGGTTQTGSIQVGRSTANQTVSIANGATTSGNTKIVNIGTDGLSGSNTTINIGSSLGVGTVTINQPTTISTNTFTVGTAAYVVANGNVGIGNTTPGSKLTVAGVIHGQATAGTGDVLIIGDDTKLVDINVAHVAGIQSTSNTAIGGLRFGSGGGTVFGSNGNIGISNTAPTVSLQVQGAILASDNITAYSDEKLKKDVTTIEGALDKVKQIRGVRYTQIDSNNVGIGVIAQEVQPHVPEVVAQNGEYLSVAYGNMVGLLIEAIKEQQQQIEALQQQVQTLNTK